MRIRGERIEELRPRLGWTQQELAEQSEVARDTISKLEAGVRNRSHGVTLGKITRTLGVDPMALSHEPCAVANGPAEAVGREVSVGRKCAAEDSEGWVPIASLQGEEAKRVLLRDVCEALDGPELTLLLQIAGRMP